MNSDRNVHILDLSRCTWQGEQLQLYYDPEWDAYGVSLNQFRNDAQIQKSSVATK